MKNKLNPVGNLVSELADLTNPGAQKRKDEKRIARAVELKKARRARNGADRRAHMPKAIGEAQLAGIRAMRAKAFTDEPRRADLILQAMRPNVYYTKRELAGLIGLTVYSLGSTFQRDLMWNGFLVKHGFPNRWRSEAGRFVHVAFKLSEKGIERAKTGPKARVREES